MKKTGRTNSSTKCREEATPKELGRTKTWSESKTDHVHLQWAENQWYGRKMELHTREPTNREDESL